ncbi:MAG: DinB family protein [Pyrinomonadaceae bacterium]
MDVRQYIIDTFYYNDYANKLVLKKVEKLDDKVECVKFFSHLINSMNKWLARIENSPGYEKLDWWKPVYQFEDLEARWDECLSRWLTFIESKTEDELHEQITWYGPYGRELRVHMGAAIKDIAIQLCYHSIHHVGQIQYLIRQQGVTPPFVDYIGTKMKPVE